MNKLLCANFARLKRSKCFWICLAVMLVYSIIYCLSEYRNKIQYGYEASLDAVFCSPYIVVGILVAVFCSLFVGTEYSDGTIRNKLVVGHSRSSIYLANFVVCAVAGLLMNLIYLAITCALGIPLLGFFQADLSIMLILLLDGLLLTVAFAAVFSLLAMLNQNKALVATISTVAAFAAIFLFASLYSRMNEPEFLEPYSITIHSAGQTVVQPGESIPNPNYLNDSQRAVVQFFLDFLPTGQAGQISGRDVPHPGLMPLYSIIIAVVMNAAGVLFFRRKDLR
jgi:ABC-2 type transport system permease protein